MSGGRVGIASYGCYVPMLRMDIGVLAEQWGLGDTLERVYRLNGRAMVAVNGLDEDTVTLSIEAAERAVRRLAPGAARPASVLIGSESHPYAVKPSGVIVADALDLGPDVFVADLEFACKGGTAALYLSVGVVESGRLPAALAIGADCPQSAPGSLLEASVGAGASAFVVARDGELIATIDHVAAASSDATDFWRRDGEQFPSVVGKFSAEVGYAEHTRRVVSSLLSATGTVPEDYQYLCLHQPYPSLPLSVAKELGFKRPQVQPGIVAGKIGNTYSSACLLGLCNVLDQAAPGDRIMLVSFGSGAGSDGFVMTVQPAIEAYRARGAELGIEPVARWVDGEHADWLTYGQYVLTQGKLRS
ncbi:MAG TPA: hydroxymethylglutaryl-CoA synthase [Kofleriaceae bacterium]|nr:hydroxymethylglutaryl-CoA synthase [Kofleriaceae bacterium]